MLLTIYCSLLGTDAGHEQRRTVKTEEAGRHPLATLMRTPANSDLGALKKGDSNVVELGNSSDRLSCQVRG